MKESERRELNERLKNESLQKEKLQSEIDSKNRELASNALLVTEKNRMFVNLTKQIDELGNYGILPAKEEKILKKQINDHLHAEDEWGYFKLHFESVHPDFFIKLKNQYPTLSENKLRLCAYIRIGMSSKQIAQMLSIQTDGVNKARYRLRKKLELIGDISLENFLRGL